MENPIYLGDAVYAHFDGNGIELKLNHPCTACGEWPPKHGETKIANLRKWAREKTKDDP